MVDGVEAPVRTAKVKSVSKKASARQKSRTCPDCGAELERKGLVCNQCGWTDPSAAVQQSASSSKSHAAVLWTLVISLLVVLALPLVFGLAIWIYFKHAPSGAERPAEPPPVAMAHTAVVERAVVSPERTADIQRVESPPPEITAQEALDPLWNAYEKRMRDRQYEKAWRALEALRDEMAAHPGNGHFLADRLPADRIINVKVVQFCDKCLLGICPVCEGAGVCPECEGKKICSVCGGRGVIEQPHPDRTCKSCKGAGLCDDCRGTGWQRCPQCKGTRYVYVQETVSCKLCGGDGYYTGNRGNQIQCPQCAGKGNLTRDVPVKCSRCEGRGSIPCPKCQGTGRCMTCLGRGWVVPAGANERGMIESTCAHCLGTGKCPTCGGYGTCPSCRGSKRCITCGGRGYVEEYVLPAMPEWLSQRSGYILFEQSPAQPIRAERKTGYLTIQRGRRRIHIEVRERELWMIKAVKTAATVP